MSLKAAKRGSFADDGTVRGAAAPKTDQACINPTTSSLRWPFVWKSIANVGWTIPRANVERRKRNRCTIRVPHHSDSHKYQFKSHTLLHTHAHTHKQTFWRREEQDGVPLWTLRPSGRLVIKRRARETPRDGCNKFSGFRSGSLGTWA